MPHCFISFNSETVSKAFDCFGNKPCSDKAAVGKVGCLELSLCFSVSDYRVIFRQCLRWSLGQVTIVQALNLVKHRWSVGREVQLWCCLWFWSISLHAVAISWDLASHGLGFCFIHPKEGNFFLLLQLKSLLPSVSAQKNCKAASEDYCFICTQKQLILVFMD